MNTAVNIIIIVATLMLVLAPMVGTSFALHARLQLPHSESRFRFQSSLIFSTWALALGAAIYTAALVIRGLTW